MTKMWPIVAYGYSFVLITIGERKRHIQAVGCTFQEFRFYFHNPKKADIA
jgi:hypothetical protein